MKPPIEARSLSSLTTLASNPPQYPRNPTHEVRQSLVLYIAKVPGSKDVFLTTIKPRERIITASDIESSLYYCHIDSERDEDVREALQLKEGASDVWQRRRENHGSVEGFQGTQRKPLLPSKPVKQQEEHQTKPNLPLRPGGQVRRTNVRVGCKDVLGVTAIGPAVTDRLPSRLQGPRPMQLREQSYNLAEPDINSGKENQIPRRPVEAQSGQPPSIKQDTNGTIYFQWHCQSSEHLRRQNTAPEEIEMAPPYGTDQEYPPSNESIVSSRLTEPSVTLIRRDPGAGAQWNVGRIIMHPHSNASGGPLRPSNRGEALGMQLSILTPGYNKFVTYDSHVPNSQHQPGFHRQILLQRLGPPSQIPSSHRSSNDYSTPPNRRSQSSQDYLPSLRPTIYPSPSHDLYFQHLKPCTFLSPWSGTCEFSTAIAGRTLKCKHTLPSPANSPGHQRSSIAPISELRFNLPTSKLFGQKSPSKRPQLAGSTPKSSSFLTSSESHNRAPSVDDKDLWQSRHRYGEDEVDSDSDERMDLSLGQEHAGGGRGGKQVKLGKLIIEDEGLKMLDLVVAANMGVWWAVYGKGVG